MPCTGTRGRRAAGLRGLRSGRAQSGAVTYTAGHEAGPAPVTAAMRLMIGDLFENRANVAHGARPPVNMSVTVERLLSLYKVWPV